jgi:hypothetical protein
MLIMQIRVSVHSFSVPLEDYCHLGLDRIQRLKSLLCVT